MKKFKKGDLVKVYGNVGKGTGSRRLPKRDEDYYSGEGWIGRVLARYHESEMYVLLMPSGCFPKRYEVTVHPKQCRFFKPKGAK